MNDRSALTEELKLGEDNSDPIEVLTVCSLARDQSFFKNFSREHANAPYLCAFRPINDRHFNLLTQEKTIPESSCLTCQSSTSVFVPIVDHKDESVLGELFTTLGRLAVRNEFCQRIVDLGGLTLMLDCLQKNLGSKVKPQILSPHQVIEQTSPI